MRNESGFTLYETMLGLLLLTAGALVVTETLESSQGATKADEAKSRAVGVGDELVRRLGLELAQTSSQVDPALPAAESQRLWMIEDGVRFQKVVGHEADGLGGMRQKWSPAIVYQWNDGAGTVTRSVTGGQTRVVARGITVFQVSSSPGGLVEVTVESRRGSTRRGVAASHNRTVRITPRNALR